MQASDELYSKLPEETKARLEIATTPRLTRYIPHRPHPKQAAFLLLDDVREVFYGGAAGGGKSDGLLMAALQYVDQPDYAALILRRNFRQLSMPGALMSRAHQWLNSTDARWRAGLKTWEFPSGAKLVFGHIGSTDEARAQYESSEWQFIGIDELTGFDEDDYRFMFSRLRRLQGSRIPIRMRSASNPVGRGRAWVKKRFVDEVTRLRRAAFVPAFLWDNPSLDAEEYVESLRELHPVLWERLLRGDWEAVDPGEVFQPRIWLDEADYLDVPPDLGVIARARYWDLAASEPTSSNTDPDWTAAARFSRLVNGLYVLEHVVRRRHTPGDTEKLFASVAGTDPPGTKQWIEQEPGASGKSLVDYYRRQIAPDGSPVAGNPPKGNKFQRSLPFAGALQKHRVKIVRANWNEPLFDELEAFSEDTRKSGPHDDQVDACSGGFEKVRLKAPSGTGAAIGGGIG